MRIEYRQTGSNRIFGFILVGIIVSFGALGIIASLTLFLSKTGFALGVLIIAGGGYYLRTILRSRMLIDDSGIEVHTAFVDRTAKLGEIAGYQPVIGRSGADTVLRLEDNRGSIEIPHAVFDIDDRFRDWLAQFPKL